MFDSLGFAILEDCISNEHVDRFLARLEAALVGSSPAIRRRRGVFAARNLIDLVPDTVDLARSDPVLALVTEILGNDARLVRALLLDKTPVANWSVTWHRDLTVAVAEQIEVEGFSAWTKKVGVVHARAPRAVLESMLTVRIQLDEDPDASGALRVIPGSHLTEEVDVSSPVTCSVPRGGALAMRPLTLHSSLPTRSEHRRIVHLEFARDPLPAPLRWHCEVPVSPRARSDRGSSNRW
jgi:hypothetical protein